MNVPTRREQHNKGFYRPIKKMFTEPNKGKKGTIMKKLLYVGGGSLLLLLALICGAVFASPLLASAHGTSTNPTTKTATKDKHPERAPLREFTRNHADELVDRIAPQIHLTAAQLTEKLKDGQHLVDIAKDKGVSREALKDILVKTTEASIDLAQKNGKIDQARATLLTKLLHDHPFVVAHVLHHHYSTKK